MRGRGSRGGDVYVWTTVEEGRHHLKTNHIMSMMEPHTCTCTIFFDV